MLVTVDTGGTKTLIARFDHRGVIDKSLKFSTPKKQEDYVVKLKQTLAEHFNDTPVEALVVALPGIIRDGVAIWCDNLGWKDFQAHATFKDTYKGVPVFIENDANLAGLAETRSIEPTPVSSLYVTISTGIGTGVITSGHIDPGLRHSEGGHIPIEFEGKMSEWEDFASGQAIHATYGLYARDIHAEAIWKQIADRISRGFLAIIPMIQPDVIIIGGSIGTYFEQYQHYLESILKKHLPSHIPLPIFIQAAHPEQAVIYGCYYYALDTINNA